MHHGRERREGEITVLTGDGVTLNAGAVRGESGIA